MTNTEKYIALAHMNLKHYLRNSGVEERIYMRGKYLRREYTYYRIREIYNGRFVLISERALFTFSHHSTV